MDVVQRSTERQREMGKEAQRKERQGMRSKEAQKEGMAWNQMGSIIGEGQVMGRVQGKKT